MFSCTRHVHRTRTVLNVSSNHLRTTNRQRTTNTEQTQQMTSFCFLFLPFFGLHLLSLVDICSGSIVLLATTGKRVTYVDDSLRRLGEQEGENLNSAAQEDMETTVVASKIFTGGMESVERRRLGDQATKYFVRTSGFCT